MKENFALIFELSRFTKNFFLLKEEKVEVKDIEHKGVESIPIAMEPSEDKTGIKKEEPMDVDSNSLDTDALPLPFIHPLKKIQQILKVRHTMPAKLESFS